MDKSEKDELRKNIRLKWLSNLGNLANYEVQQRWLDKKIANPAWSYVEFMCCYFDDVLAGGGYEQMIQCGIITQAESDCVLEFHNALDKYLEPNGHYDQKAILEDVRWQKIVALGELSVTKLVAVLIDPAEKSALIERPALTEKDYTWPD